MSGRKPVPGPVGADPPAGAQIAWQTSPIRRRATFNLSDQVQRELEKLWMRLRVDREIPTSKSEIVEIAIQLVIEEVAAKGENAALVRRLSGDAKRT
jgi:hypothetical protein